MGRFSIRQWRNHLLQTHLVTTSGAIQYGVPTIVVLLSRSSVIWAQNPKSVSLTCPSIPRRTLSLFMSLLKDQKLHMKHDVITHLLNFSAKYSLLRNSQFIWNIQCVGIVQVEQPQLPVMGVCILFFLLCMVGDFKRNPGLLLNRFFRVCSQLNICSLWNTAGIPYNFLCEHFLQVLALNETWF